MRFRTFTLLFFSFVLTGLLGTGLYAQSSVTFQVDMKGTGFKRGTHIGLRGSVAPLSWDNSLEMTDPDKDGIYTVTVIFTTAKAGDRVLYKYTADDVWDNDLFGPYGNRAVTLWSTPQILQVEKWNTVVNFSYESLLEHATNAELDLIIYMLGKAKMEGKTAADVAHDIAKFWGDYSWVFNLHTVLSMEHLNQSKYNDGYFLELENTPKRIKFRMNKMGTYYFANRTENGQFKGVSQKDLNILRRVYYENLAKDKGWKLTWEEGDGDFVVTLQSK